MRINGSPIRSSLDWTTSALVRLLSSCSGCTSMISQAFFLTQSDEWDVLNLPAIADVEDGCFDLARRLNIAACWATCCRRNASRSPFFEHVKAPNRERCFFGTIPTNARTARRGHDQAALDSALRSTSSRTTRATVLQSWDTASKGGPRERLFGLYDLDHHKGQEIGTSLTSGAIGSIIPL